MPHWVVARTLVHREPLAARRLEAVGFEAFAPRTLHGPLFPGYLFVRVIDQWRVIDRTVGVLTLVKFGEAPARCPDAEIEKLYARLGDDGLVRLPARPPEGARAKLSIGDKVRVAGLNAIYAGMGKRERERVLIHLLGRQILADVRSGALEPVKAVLAAAANPR
jgi:transcriptional antiterminator RfaH